MACFGSPIPNNDWLISPSITLGTTGNVVSFWAKTCEPVGTGERFKVGISTSNTTAGVTLLSTGSYVTVPANATWVQYTYPIPASFNGQPVYISINCVSIGSPGSLAVDDFKVTTTGQLSTIDIKNSFTESLSIYPNPSTGIVNIVSKNSTPISTVQVIDLNGKIVKDIDTKGNSNLQLNISDLTTGSYFLNAQTKSGLETFKIIKK